jgi:membrane associated rhomboid family serine protease
MLSLIPISDANPTRRFPIVTVAVIVLNVLSFVAEPGFGGGIEGSVYFFDNAPIPCQLDESCPAGVDLGPEVVRIPERGPVEFLIAVVISTFLHAGFLHIIGNMLFLWVFGNNIEDYLGRVRFLIFYLLGGIAASFAHILTHTSSVLPTVGASGAVAAVMGAYLVLYPKARVNVLVPIFFFFSVIQMSAIAVLGLWFVYQFFIGLQEASGATAVAWMAHVGGFVYGVVIIYLLGGRPQAPQMVWRPEWRY